MKENTLMWDAKEKERRSFLQRRRLIDFAYYEVSNINILFFKTNYWYMLR